MSSSSSLLHDSLDGIPMRFNRSYLLELSDSMLAGLQAEDGVLYPMEALDECYGFEFETAILRSLTVEDNCCDSCEIDENISEANDIVCDGDDSLTCAATESLNFVSVSEYPNFSEGLEFKSAAVTDNKLELKTEPHSKVLIPQLESKNRTGNPELTIENKISLNFDSAVSYPTWLFASSPKDINSEVKPEGLPEDVKAESFGARFKVDTNESLPEVSMSKPNLSSIDENGAEISTDADLGSVPLVSDDSGICLADSSTNHLTVSSHSSSANQASVSLPTRMADGQRESTNSEFSSSSIATSYFVIAPSDSAIPTAIVVKEEYDWLDSDGVLKPVPASIVSKEREIPGQSKRGCSYETKKSHRTVTLADFEGDSSPFDNVALKSLNDLEELSTVLGLQHVRKELSGNNQHNQFGAIVLNGAHGAISDSGKVPVMYSSAGGQQGFAVVDSNSNQTSQNGSNFVGYPNYLFQNVSNRLPNYDLNTTDCRVVSSSNAYSKYPVAIPNGVIERNLSQNFPRPSASNETSSFKPGDSSNFHIPPGYAPTPSLNKAEQRFNAPSTTAFQQTPNGIIPTSCTAAQTPSSVSYGNLRNHNLISGSYLNGSFSAVNRPAPLGRRDGGPLVASSYAKGAGATLSTASSYGMGSFGTGGSSMPFSLNNNYNVNCDSNRDLNSTISNHYAGFYAGSSAGLPPAISSSSKLINPLVVSGAYLTNKPLLNGFVAQSSRLTESLLDRQMNSSTKLPTQMLMNQRGPGGHGDLTKQNLEYSSLRVASDESRVVASSDLGFGTGLKRSFKSTPDLSAAGIVSERR